VVIGQRERLRTLHRLVELARPSGADAATPADARPGLQLTGVLSA
jgi:hypothetical protein